ncbi:DUF1310 family protein [Streptococcus chenjunshii]|uniref:DUF1310 family protein n=1 Tax=Streptococcus chenjunshii TaxID=2173853 RepID=A0A372KKQ0_9STRE|nr:DUF1310 family protein [Streptococcus chenjunshii]AXQ78238.1 DUF1310 family protein [Streptococcus chenjunshii]RFU49955.1 DUF1310 family protein [Streptococcus chenjunshii]RFU52148.1 DUF1310 family protein [Streptococcus chenjunshii]
MMTKRLKIWLVLLLVGAGITAGGAGYMKYQEHKEREVMLEIVKSEEVSRLLDEEINYYNSKSTGPAIIDNYTIDYTSLRRNPMGGISVKLIINNNSRYFIRYVINTNANTGQYESTGNVLSVDLSHYLEKNGVSYE